MELSLGMTVFRAEHAFTPAAFGQMVKIAEIEGSYPTTSLMAQIVRGSRIVHVETYPEGNVIFSPGQDLFRLSDRLKLRPEVDASADSTMTALTIGVQTLEYLIGRHTAQRTLEALGITPAPKVVVRPIPLTVSDHLHQVIPLELTGAARRMTAQARALTYLTALITHLGTDEETGKTLTSSQLRARKLYELLVGMEGKVPSLEDLAQQFDRSARTLSNDFQGEYGQTIATFVAERRLTEAHAAIASSDIPLKIVADRLGYAHLNHFIRAFRKKFGYPPGSLRKGK